MFGVDDVLTGGLSLAGGVMNNIFAGKRQDDAQAFNAQQADANRQWQESMSNTAYRRSANDMQAAGLNRILAVGHGASSPGGNAASSSPGAPVHDMIGPAVNTAMQSARLKEEITNMKETNKNIHQDTEKKAAETYAGYMHGHSASAQTSKIKNEDAIVVENLMDAKTRAVRSKIEHDQLNNPLYRVLRQTGNIGEETQRASSALGNLPALINAGTARKNANTRHDTFKERFGLD